MIFKEKMFLSNCDPVRRLSVAEIEKRFLLAVTFAEGAIVTPSALLDNAGFATVFARQNLHKWYREEGSGTLIVRAPGNSSTASMTEYFDALPPNHFLTRFGQRKENLSRLQITEMRDELAALDRSLQRLSPKAEGAGLTRNALTDAILHSDELAAWRRKGPESAQKLAAIDALGADLASRSDWYRLTNEILGPEAPAFRLEVVDACYNSLFVSKGEAFAMDCIPYLDKLPAPLLDVGVSIRSLRREKEILDYVLKGADLFTAFGAGQLAQFVIEEALSYVEDKVQDTSLNWATRRNWFGLYPFLVKSIGVKIK